MDSVVDWGFNWVVSDADVVWFRDPTPLLAKYPMAGAFPGGRSHVINVVVQGSCRGGEVCMSWLAGRRQVGSTTHVAGQPRKPDPVTSVSRACPCAVHAVGTPCRSAPACCHRLSVHRLPCPTFYHVRCFFCRSAPADFLFSEDGAQSRNDKGDAAVEHGGSEHSNFNTGLFSRAVWGDGGRRDDAVEHGVPRATRLGFLKQHTAWPACTAQPSNCPPTCPMHFICPLQACTCCVAAPAARHSSTPGPRHFTSAALG